MSTVCNTTVNPQPAVAQILKSGRVMIIASEWSPAAMVGRDRDLITAIPTFTEVTPVAVVREIESALTPESVSTAVTEDERLIAPEDTALTELTDLNDSYIAPTSNCEATI